MDYDEVTAKREIANPLPYLITFTLLFLIALGVLTWVLDVWYKTNQCIQNPNIWCSNDWTCNNIGTACPNGNACFSNPNFGVTGLANCLFGIGSPLLQRCEGNTEPGGVACVCPTNMTKTNNCFSSCATSIRDATKTGARCCCKPGVNGCPTTVYPECSGLNP